MDGVTIAGFVIWTLLVYTVGWALGNAQRDRP